MRAETLQWLAELRGCSKEVLAREIQGSLRRQSQAEFGTNEPDGVDAEVALRSVEPFGPQAGMREEVGKVSYRLVVSLPGVRVWLSQWSAQRHRSMSAPVVRWQVHGRAMVDGQQEAASRWHDVGPSDVPSALDAQVWRAVWARLVQRQSA